MHRVPQLMATTGENCYNSSFDFSKQKKSVITAPASLEVKICHFSLSYTVVNLFYSGFGLLVEQNKMSEDITLAFRKLWWIYFYCFVTFIGQMIT